MDILLTHGYFLYEDPKELQIMKPYPPLGILYICAHLRRKGMEVEVFDSTFSTRQQLLEALQNGPSVGTRYICEPDDTYQRGRDLAVR